MKRVDPIALALLGVFGALLMFAGDMFLYFKNVDYGYFKENIVTIMGGLPSWRLQLGGFLGPVAAFFLIFGYESLRRTLQPTHPRTGRLLFLLYLFGIILGGSYHSHFTYLGHAAFYETAAPGISGVFEGLLMPYIWVNFTLQIGVSLYLGILVLTGKTSFPRWFVLLTPIVTILLKPLVSMLPGAAAVVLSGGWFNLMNVVFFLAIAIHLKKHPIPVGPD